VTATKANSLIVAGAKAGPISLHEDLSQPPDISCRSTFVDQDRVSWPDGHPGLARCSDELAARRHDPAENKVVLQNCVNLRTMR
jgi:hypothetical protein